MKYALAAILAICALAAIFWPRHELEPEVVGAKARTKRSPQSPIAAPSVIHGEESDAEDEVRRVHELLVTYLRALQRRPGPPIGDDVDLARVLKGHNPMRRAWVSPEDGAFSADGHLCDRWGTPYHIHALGGNAYDVRSAGPDKRLFTMDDSVWPERDG